MSKHNATIEERLNARTVKDEDGCWRWTGALTTPLGYGRIGIRGEWFTVHVLAYQTFVGPIPEGHDVGHKCHDEAAEAGLCETTKDGCVHRSCWRPEHLQPEPRGANLLASPLTQATINKSKTHCKREHEFTPENTRIKANGWRSCKACDKLGVEGRRKWDEEHGV